MSVKRDASGRQSIQVEVEVPGAVEEVWKAVATGPGISSWFCPTEIEEKTGGVIRTLMGPGMESLARVTVWDPPRRLAAEGPGAGPDAEPMTTEWIVEPRAADACLVRVIHSMSGGTDEQREQLEGIECGWPYFFAILRVYLAHFRGQPVSIVRTMGQGSSPVNNAWSALTDALGITGLGESARWTSPSGTPSLTGIVEQVGGHKQPYAAIRLDGPIPGIASASAFSMGDCAMITMGIYLYGDEASAIAARDEPAWQEWMNACLQ